MHERAGNNYVTSTNDISGIYIAAESSNKHFVRILNGGISYLQSINGVLVVNGWKA